MIKKVSHQIQKVSNEAFESFNREILRCRITTCEHLTIRLSPLYLYSFGDRENISAHRSPLHQSVDIETWSIADELSRSSSIIFSSNSPA